LGKHTVYIFSNLMFYVEYLDLPVVMLYVKYVDWPLVSSGIVLRHFQFMLFS